MVSATRSRARRKTVSSADGSLLTAESRLRRWSSANLAGATLPTIAAASAAANATSTACCRSPLAATSVGGFHQPHGKSRRAGARSGGSNTRHDPIDAQGSETNREDRETKPVWQPTEDGCQRTDDPGNLEPRLETCVRLAPPGMGGLLSGLRRRRPVGRRCPQARALHAKATAVELWKRRAANTARTAGRTSEAVRTCCSFQRRWSHGATNVPANPPTAPAARTPTTIQAGCPEVFRANPTWKRTNPVAIRRPAMPIVAN